MAAFAQLRSACRQIRDGDAPGPGRNGFAGAWPMCSGAGNYLSTTASTSRAERMRYSSPEYLTSVPPYLL